jgi:hypothetical protein
VIVMRLTRIAVVVSAAVLGLLAAAPARAGSEYRSLDDAELLRVVGDLDLLKGSYTHIMLSGPAAGYVREMGVCDVELPAGRLAFHLVEETETGADQAAAIIDEPGSGGPAAYLKKIAAGTCGVEPIKAEGVPGDAVSLTDHDAPIPFVAVVPRGKVILLVEAGTRDAMVTNTVAAVAAYDGLARTDKASS